MRADHKPASKRGQAQTSKAKADPKPKASEAEEAKKSADPKPAEPQAQAQAQPKPEPEPVADAQVKAPKGDPLTHDTTGQAPRPKGCTLSGRCFAHKMEEVPDDPSTTKRKSSWVCPVSECGLYGKSEVCHDGE